MDPNACIAAINEACTSGWRDYPLAWRFTDLRYWLRHGGYVPTLPLCAAARRRLIRSGYGDVVRTLEGK